MYITIFNYNCTSTFIPFALQINSVCWQDFSYKYPERLIYY